MQQTKATKLIPVTPKNINYIGEELGLPERLSEDMSQDDLDKILGVEQKDDSRASDGMSKGSDNGTSDNPSEVDNSANNLYNS